MTVNQLSFKTEFVNKYIFNQYLAGKSKMHPLNE